MTLLVSNEHALNSAVKIVRFVIAVRLQLPLSAVCQLCGRQQHTASIYFPSCFLRIINTEATINPLIISTAAHTLSTVVGLSPVLTSEAAVLSSDDAADDADDAVVCETAVVCVAVDPAVELVPAVSGSWATI